MSTTGILKGWRSQPQQVAATPIQHIVRLKANIKGFQEKNTDLNCG